MAKRIPPSAEQIEQALTDHLMALPAEFSFRAVLPMVQAQRVIAETFNTSHAKARDWLFDIAASDSHPVEVLQIGGAGSLSAVLRPGVTAGKVRWQPLASAYGHTFMTLTPRTQMAWSSVAVIDPANAKYNPQAERPADEAEFVAVTKYLQPLVQEYADHYLAQKVTREGEQILQAATVEHHHGDGLAYIRGLLDAAIVHHPSGDDELLRVRMGNEGRVTIELVGDAIDKVGALLHDLGVQPKREGD